MTETELDITYLYLSHPLLVTQLQRALGKDYGSLRTYTLDIVTRELMSVVPEFVHVTEPEFRYKNERMLLFDAKHNLMAEVPRKVTKWHGDNNRGIVFDDGSSLRDVVESLERRNDLKYIVWMQCWAGKYLERRDRIIIYEVIDFDLVKMRFKVPAEIARECEESKGPVETESTEEYTQRSHERRDGEIMVQQYIMWPIFLRWLLPAFGHLNPPRSPNPNIQAGIDYEKKRLGLYGKYLQKSL